MSVRTSWAPLVVFALWLGRSALLSAGADTAALVLEFALSVAIGYAAGPKAWELGEERRRTRGIRRRWGTELAGLGVKPRQVKSAIVHHTITMPAVRFDDDVRPYNPEPVDHSRTVYFELKDGRTVSAELAYTP